MKFIKNIPGHLFFVYGMLLFIATMLVVLIPIWIISKLPEPKRARALHIVFQCWMGAYLTLTFSPVFRKGKEYFKKGKTYVVVINHNSLADIPVSSPWIPVPNKTLAKIEMSKIPLFGIIYRAGSILLDRKHGGSRRESFSKMQETLELGINLCLYPEGTRNKTNKAIQPFFDGAFITAIKAQKAIIPALIFNTGKIMPYNKVAWMRPMPIYFHFLEPIETEGLTLDNVVELKEKVHQVMEMYYLQHLNNKA